jgi:hypothetical protein
MRQVVLVVIDAIRNIVEILFLIRVQVLAPLKRVDRLKGFAKSELITYRPRKINSAELRVGLRKDLGKEGHIANLRLFKVSSSLDPLEYFRSCRGHKFQKDPFQWLDLCDQTRVCPSQFLNVRLDFKQTRYLRLTRRI